MKFNLSINKNIINKGNPYTQGWQNSEFDTQRLIDHVAQGFAFSPGVLKANASEKKPSSSDIAYAQLLAVDVDNEIKTYNADLKKYEPSKKSIAEGYLTFEEIVVDPFVEQYALFVYRTPSFTDDWHKFRIVFLLPEAIYDPSEYSKVAKAFITKFGADASCSNIDRMFFGNNLSSQAVVKYENTVSKDVLIHLLKSPILEQKEVKKYQSSGLNGSLSPDDVAEMLEYIPSRMSYDEWGKIVSAVGNYFDEDTAVTLIEKWSPDEKIGTRYKIQHRSKKPTIGSVVYFAKQYGFDSSKLAKKALSSYEVDGDGRLVNKKKEKKEYQSTELGNSERFIDQWANKVKYNFTSDKWHIWTGSHWECDNRSKVMQLGKKTVRRIYEEVKNEDNDSRRGELLKHAIKSESKGQIEAMIKLASSHPVVAAEQSDFDANLYTFNVENGTYNLQSNLFTSHDPKQMIAKCAGVELVPDADCPVFKDAMLTWFNDDEEVIAFIQRALGLTLCGAHLEEVLFFAYGTGKNGKSIFFQIMKNIFGDYFQKAPTEMLLLQRQEGIPNDIARLPGARLVVAEELPEGRSLNENKVKNLTGGDVISARFLHKEFFDFTPTHTLWIYGNHKPTIRGTDEGIWRRICMVPFTVTIPEEDRRPHTELMADFDTEKSGIFNWILQGWVDYQSNGLKPPAVVQQATKEYREENDKIADFVNECLEFESKNKVVAKELLAAYFKWCGESHEEPMTKTKFYKRMERYEGVKTQIASQNLKTFYGIDLKNHVKSQNSAF